MSFAGLDSDYAASEASWVISVDTSADIVAIEQAEPLPMDLAAPSVRQTEEGHVLVAGGIGVFCTCCSSATISGNVLDGRVTAWIGGPALPQPRTQSLFASDSAYAYRLGGRRCGPAAPDDPDAGVWFSPVLNGQLTGPWSPTTPLPEGIAAGYAWVVGSRVYVTGGVLSSGYNTTTYVAEIGAGGALSPWTTGMAIPLWHIRGSPIQDGSYLYVVSGASYGVAWGDGVTLANEVRPDGTLYLWEVGPPAPLSTWATHAAAATSGHLWVLGGGLWPFAPSSTIYRAQRNGRQLSSWSSVGNLPSGVVDNRAVRLR